MSQLQDNLNEIKRQKDLYLLPENIKKNITILGVTGTLEGGSSEGVKLFDTVEEMNADPNPQEGDLAVVYREELIGITENSEFNSCIFPNTVVLDEAFTSEVYGNFMAIDGWFDGMVNISSSDFTFNGYGESSEIRVQYESQDGITYTRTDGGEELQEFGVTIIWEPREEFNNVIGNFMKISGNYFDGMYKYGLNNTDENNSYLLINSQLNAIADYVYNKTFYGKNGVENGTLTTNVNNTFADVNAEVYVQIQKQYDNMQPRVLTDQDKTVNTNIMIIPCKSNGTPLIDTSSVTNMTKMFYRCASITTIPLLDTSKATNMSNMFGLCTSLTTIPLLDTSNVTDMNNMFFSCKSLTTIPLIDTGKVTDMTDMFNNCPSLVTIPLLDTSNVTDMGGLFNDCTSLAIVPLLDTSDVTDMGTMFYKCTSLTTIPLLDTGSVTSMYNMFFNCPSLVTVPLLDTSNVTNMSYMFYNCNNLSNESLNNIMQMCINATKITSNKTLAYIGLTKAQANICATLSNYQAFVNAGWTTGY